MGTRKIFIYCLPVFVESPWPDPFAFCFLLPLPQGRVKLQEAEHHVFLSPQPNIHRTSCLLWTTQAKGGILLLQELWEVLLLLSGLLMFTSLLVSPIFCPLHPKGAAWYSCGGSGSCSAAEPNWRELESKRCLSLVVPPPGCFHLCFLPSLPSQIYA